MDTLSVTELECAEQIIIRHVQGQVFDNEIRCLSQKGQVSRSSSVRKLSPFMSNDCIMLVGGRLRHATVSCQAKHPVLLPRDHAVSRMIISDYHNAAHLGTEWTLSRLRGKYWIVNARNLIKGVRMKCIVCKRLYAQPPAQRMADLPPDRCLSGQPPFTNVGVDLFGTFHARQGRSTVKRYGCVYTCFSTRAIHIEVLNSLDTDTFINGFIRFVARRGYPRKVISDNGTNLVGADAELRRSLRQLDRSKVIQAARRVNVDWCFNPPLASHHGGVWERMIRTIRKVLAALLSSNLRLTDEVLHTVMCEAENIVNSRPITKVSDDADDMNALTPNHLLIMRDNNAFPWGIVSIAETYRRSWRHVQRIIDMFWKRWVKQHLVELQKRPKWLNVDRNVRKGDLVLLVDDNAQRGAWPLGLVVDVKEGRDGLVRSARVRTKCSELVRPITKMVLLEGCDLQKA